MPVMEPALPVLACDVPAAPPGGQDHGPALPRKVIGSWKGETQETFNSRPELIQAHV